jgi:hypothetical protein
MKNHIRALVASVVLASTAVASVPACTALQAAPIVDSLPPLASCIIQAAGADFVEALSDPLSLLPAIASACIGFGTVTAAAIVHAIESWFASAPAVDSGTAASQVQAARLKRVHDVFVAAMVANHK